MQHLTKLEEVATCEGQNLALGAMRAETGKISSQSGISRGTLLAAWSQAATTGTTLTIAGLEPSFLATSTHSLP